jgi:DNA polymerase I-like protein with 3'-5' exonuclease and polymerase domains
MVRDTYLRTWPEQKKYFREISKRCGYSTFTAEHFVSRRRRGFVGYTDGCNTYFQGLAADLAKAALWKVVEEMYSKPESPLYGGAVIAMIHDEILAELPEATASDAAKRMTELMLSVGAQYTPDVKLSAEPVLMRYWAKGAKTSYDENDNLEIYGDEA